MRSKYFIAVSSLILAIFLCVVAAPAARAQGPSTHQSNKNGTGDFYSCPMHPDVRAKKKGRCPVCGMDLRLTRAESKPADDTVGEGVHASRASYGSSKMTIPDVELLDQDGRKVRFYTDLVKGKVVAVQFIFTTCTTICPPLGATFARVQ